MRNSLSVSTYDKFDKPIGSRRCFYLNSKLLVIKPILYLVAKKFVFNILGKVFRSSKDIWFWSKVFKFLIELSTSWKTLLEYSYEKFSYQWAHLGPKKFNGCGSNQGSFFGVFVLSNKFFLEYTMFSHIFQPYMYLHHKETGVAVEHELAIFAKSMNEQ